MEDLKGMKLVKTDKNGSKYYEGLSTCPKCNGAGLIVHHMENGQPSWNWTDGGVCWKCSGEGKVFRKIIIRTPEYEAVLAERRRKKAEAKKAKREAEIDQIRKDWLKSWGFSEDGFIYIVLGDTYSRKDQIKDLGGHFNHYTGWYLDREVEGFQFLKVSKDQILFETYNGYDWLYDLDLKQMKKEEERKLNRMDSVSEYQGTVKERLRNLKLTVTMTTTFETKGGSFFMGDKVWFYSFKDDQGNVFTWTASSPAGVDGGDYFRPLNTGDTCRLTGTVKNHKEYKGEKQTVLTRCKVHSIDTVIPEYKGEVEEALDMLCTE